LTREQHAISQTYPGLLDLSPRQAAAMYGDDHSLFHGEVKRMRRLERYLKEFVGKRERMGYTAQQMHDDTLMAFHDFFVNDVKRPNCVTMPMYEGGPRDFESNRNDFVRSIRDVENIYRHLVKLLPKQLNVHGEWIETVRALEIDPDVRIEDPLELLRLARHGDRRIRHQARSRLVLAQACFGARRDGYAPDQLAKAEEDLRAFVGRALFTDPEGEPMHVVAELDPHDHYMCRKVEFLPQNGDPAPEAGPSRFVMQAYRQSVPRRRKPGSDPIRIFHFIRHKERMMLKMLDKKVVFPKITGIGDPLAMMFVVDHDDLSRLVSEVREILVPCPGMVADMNSSIGWRKGAERLDPKNRRSSRLYEAMKYVARMQDRIVEVQFLPMAAWINALAARNDVNHRCYKMKRYLDTAYPLLFPTTWSGIPWADAALRRQCIGHSLGR
jgi:hypothetical protein